MIRRPLLLLSIAVLLVGLVGGVWFYQTRWVPPHLRSSSTLSVLVTDFDADHRETNGGQIEVVIPEVYELFNVALALTDASRNNPYRYADHGSPYYEEVMSHFGPYADHPVVAEIEASLGRFPSHRALFAYTFEEDAIVPGGPYAGSWRDQVFEDYLPLLEDFAAVSNYREFYAAHRPYYEEQIAIYQATVPLDAIWSWLEAEFPEEYAAHTVVISPLVSGTHNAFCYKDRNADYWEGVMFVPAPDAARTPDDTPEDVRGALMTRQVFTEIDHLYVNPVTDGEATLEAVDLALRDFESWNSQNGYATPALTFNEYMTWATYTLFAREAYDPEVFGQANSYTVALMEEWRGFPRFGAFNEALLEMYEQRAPGTTVAELYPEILTWTRAQ